MESAGKLVMSGRGGCLMLQRHPILENERTAQAGVPQCVQHEISQRSDTDVGEEAVLRVGTCTQYPYHSLLLTERTVCTMQLSFNPFPPLFTLKVKRV